MANHEPLKKPRKGLVSAALDAAAAASLTLSGTRSLAPFAASFTLEAASEGLLGPTSSAVSLAAARRHAHLSYDYSTYIFEIPPSC